MKFFIKSYINLIKYIFMFNIFILLFYLLPDQIEYKNNFEDITHATFPELSLTF